MASSGAVTVEAFSQIGRIWNGPVKRATRQRLQPTGGGASSDKDKDQYKAETGTKLEKEDDDKNESIA